MPTITASSLKDIITQKLAEYDDNKGFLKQTIPVIGYALRADPEDIQRLRVFNANLTPFQEPISPSVLGNFLTILCQEKTTSGHLSHKIFADLTQHILQVQF